MTGFLTVLQAVGAFIGVWALVSVVTAIVVIPWFRARALANDALARTDRAADWGSAVVGDQVAELAER
jgi:quinol-cytochrome oxidoreductase complex cytochrome b subunit